MATQLLTRSAKVADLKNRINIIRDQLPPNWKTIVFQKYPKYDSNAGANRINNVIALKSTDTELTEILEAIVQGNNKVA